MSLSQAEIALIVEELKPMCERSTLQHVREPGPRRLALRFRQPGETRWLLISTEQDGTRLHFVDDKPPQPNSPSPFAMLGRKWLHGASLKGVEQVHGDRIIRLTLHGREPRTEASEADETSPSHLPIHLVAELAGRVGNIFLLTADDKILGMQTDEAIASRQFDIGDRWTPPPPPPDSDAGETVRWNLASRSPDELARSAKVAHAYAEWRRLARRDDLYEHLVSTLREQIERFERRIEHVEQDLDNVRDADRYRRRAELLQSAYGKVERGAESVTVPDFYRDGMPEVEISLDPKKDLPANNDAYYHQARRYEDALDQVEKRLLESIELRDRTEQRLEDLREQDDATLDELQTLQQQLREEGLLPSRNESGDPSRDSERSDSKLYRTFRARSGRRILVGRSAEENDTLSTKIARGRDFWFHARDWSGAHVVLRLQNRDESPDSEDLVDAATLAAHFSKGRNDTAVEVSYTRAKHVRKYGDLPPGRVSVSNEKTIGVRLEEGRLQRLLDSEESGT